MLALQWIQKNIHNFGGNPRKVLLSGFSAGGASVQFHYFSPLSRGLFAAGVSHSGFALNPWMVTNNPREQFEKFCAMLNCKFNDLPDSIGCLKAVPAADLTRLIANFSDSFFTPTPGMPFAVVVEQQGEAFLEDLPINLMERDDFAKVPWLTTVTEEDGLYPVAECLRIERCFEELNGRWATICKGFSAKNVSAQILEEYFGDSPIDESHFKELTQLYTDRYFYYDLGKAVQGLFRKTPTFVAIYKFKAQFGFGELLAGRTGRTGVAHGDDVTLLFKTPLRDNHPLSLDEEDMGAKLLELYDALLNG